MIRTIVASIFAVFLFMGINIPQQETEQGVEATATSLFVPAAIAEENKDSKDKVDSKDDEDSKDKADSKDDEDSKDTSSTSTSGVLICSALSVVEQKVSTLKTTEKKAAASEQKEKAAEKKAADSEKEAKDAKDKEDAKKAELDDDDSASESEKKDEDKHAKEKDDEYEKAKTEHDDTKSKLSEAKKEHDDTKSKLNEAQTELAAAQTAVSTSPCTTVSGKPGYWSNTAGTPAPTTTTAPKSLREVHGQ